MIKPLPSLMLLTMTTLLLSGCADRIGLAEQAMQDIRASQAQEVEPTPKVSLVEDFVYSASSLRSPFFTTKFGEYARTDHGYRRHTP